MGRKRTKKENKGLPERWSYTHGAYYYNVKKGAENQWDGKRRFRLGKTLTEAHRAWSDRLIIMDRANTVGQLLDRYAVEIVPTKAPATQIENVKYIFNLRAVFGEMGIGEITPQIIYKYIDKRSKKSVNKDGKIVGGASIARHEIHMFSHAYKKAVKWGYISTHPFKGEVEFEGSQSRDRYIEDWEILEVLSMKSPRKNGGVKLIQAYIGLKLLTGMRKGELLRIKMKDITGEGITFTPLSKGGINRNKPKPITYTWTDATKAAIAEIIAARPVDISPYLFCNKFGKGYFEGRQIKPEAWNSMWQRFMARALEETQIKERFTEHDLRAKCASDAESTKRAQELLSHTNARITERVYRRKPKTIKPLK